MKLIKVLFLVIVGLVITNVTLTNKSVDEGIVVSDLTNSIAELQNENMIIAAEIASAGALGNLTPKLTAAGYVESREIVSIPAVSSVASR